MLAQTCTSLQTNDKFHDGGREWSIYFSLILPISFVAISFFTVAWLHFDMDKEDQYEIVSKCMGEEQPNFSYVTCFGVIIG